MEAGHNNPPDFTITAAEVTQELSAWLSESPVIENTDQAKEAKVFIDRGSLCVRDLEDERFSKVGPLNDQVKKINDYYKGPRELLKTVVEELKYRLTKFLAIEEAKRKAIAQAAREAAQDAERRAREAEQVEQERLGSADSGELGIDVAAHVVEADRAFADYEKAERQAAIAEKESHVKVTGGFSRALSLKSVETPLVEDAYKAIKAMGVTPYISEAIIKSARLYKKQHGAYPPGIGVKIERKA